MASSAEAAAHIDLSRVAFAELIAKGIIKKPDKRGGYNLTEVRLAYIRHMRKIASGRAGGANGDALTAERTLLTRAKRVREERLAGVEAGQLVRLVSVRRALEGMLISMRDRLLGLPGEASFMLAMRPQQEVFEILDGMVRDKLEELADPDGFAARAAAAGIEGESGEAHRSDNDGSEDDAA
jgi:hypothetical protein